MLPLYLTVCAETDHTELFNVGSIYRLDKIPVIVRMDEPAETDHRVVEQVFVPKILDALDRDAADDRADDLEFNVARESAFGPDRCNKIRLIRRRVQRL